MHEQAWLNYQANNDYSCKHYFKSVNLNFSGVTKNNILGELETFTTSVFGKKIEEVSNEKDSTLILSVGSNSTLGHEGYRISSTDGTITISGSSSVGILYGVFSLIRKVCVNQDISDLSEESHPSNPLRMLNHWDNMSGHIERGYSGMSFFFEDGNVVVNQRTIDYARLISSIGINAVSINNVNVYDAKELITDKWLPKVKEISDIFNGYGIKLFLSISFASPMDIGGLDSSDPLNQDVINWWNDRADIVYKAVPDLGGFLVKADSEGRPGPFSYNRTHADGANMLAKAIEKYNGTLIWRCFVYNCQQDWRDLKTDRARSGYDNFMALDGTFNDNVILQIKNGPMDFQVREPVSPLLGGLEKTNQLLEFQIAQEYTGQQKHVCYLIPWFKEVLSFKTYCKDSDDSIKDIVSGKTFNQSKCGIVAVTNTGNDENWTGHDFAAANLYGLGRLAWDTSLDAEEISKEWTALTFGTNGKVIETINSILMSSWLTYEKYNAPLGIGWMVNPNHHFGPNVDGYEYDRWGTYHRADHKGIGVDRTENGTGYVDQYRKENADMYRNIDTCPDNVILFFHHLGYDHKLDSGKTLIQHIYDTHFEGVEDVDKFIADWKGLETLVDKKRYNRVLERLEFQLYHAKEWRDVINSYFYRKSGISDLKGRTIY